MTQVRWRARVLTPRDPSRVELVPDALVELQGGRIAQVRAYAGEPVDEDLRDGVLVPGFVDAHLHYPQTRIVGSATGPLLDWLERSTFPEEARFADEAHARAVAERFCTSLARAGTTWSLVYGPVFPRATDVLLEVAAARGLRMMAGPVLMDEHCPEALRLPQEPAMAALRDLARRWHGRQGMQIAVIPRFALSCSASMLAAAGELAADLGLVVSTHLAETVDECRIACERFDAPDYLAVYERAGLVRAGSVFAHCIHLSDAEWDRLAEAGCVVAHCPDSNDFLGSGGMPVGEPVRRGVQVALGTDLAAGRTFRVPRIASSAYDNGLRRGHPLPPAQVLWWATRGGALALGRPDAGWIAPGHAADLALFAPPPWAETADDIVAALVFDHDAEPMRRTWVAGRTVWEA
ncbi:MAG: guanine deaminase [Myxococcota bacterium]